MSMILERVTYYDLYGYAVPGCLLSLLCFSDKFPEIISVLRELPKKALPYCFLIWVFGGMVAGIILTVIAEFFWGTIFQMSDESYLKEPALGISYKVIKKALLNARVAEDATKLENPRDLQKWMWYMYASVQADEHYKRIHNYASSQLMYGNLSVAIGIGGTVAVMRAFIETRYKVYIVLGIVAASLLSGWRCRQFMVKKQTYTIFWFVEKYAGPRAARVPGEGGLRT